METSDIPTDEAKEVIPTPDSAARASAEPTPRKRRASKSLDERIAALTEQAAQLRKARKQHERHQHDRLIKLVGSAMLAMLEQDAALRSTLTARMLAQMTRPADRELLHMWLASLPTVTHTSPQSDENQQR